MGRGGARAPRDGPERRCIASGESGDPHGLIRFALSPDGIATPDLAERLPGRGVWVTAERGALELAERKRLFARGFKAPARAPEGLADMIEDMLARRLVEAISLARKAGLAVTGFEKVKSRLREGQVTLLFAARDGSEDGRAKLRALAGGAEIADCLNAAELGAAFGRDMAVHAALTGGGAAKRAIREARRLDGLRGKA